jgi:hypothetical protein
LPQAARPASSTNVSANVSAERGVTWDTRILGFSGKKQLQIRRLEDQTRQAGARQMAHLAAALAAMERFV